MVQMTEQAMEQVTKLIERDGRDGLFLRLGVKGGGCSGFLYILEFETATGERDEEVSFGDIRVILDPKSNILLEDVTLHWHDGLDGSGWKWTNPNAAGSCGCGESFAV